MTGFGQTRAIDRSPITRTAHVAGQIAKSSPDPAAMGGDGWY
jgi:hypothetical protein